MEERGKLNLIPDLFRDLLLFQPELYNIGLKNLKRVRLKAP